MEVKEGYKQTEVGVIPNDWTINDLGELTEKIVGGGTPSRSNQLYWGQEIPWVTVKDFSTFNSCQTQEYITQEGLRNSASHLIPKGVIITSTRMALGKAVIYKVDVSINQDLKAIFPSKELYTWYLYYWFQLNSKSIEKLGSGSTVMGLSLPDLRKIKLKCPPLPEQQAIAEVLTDTDNLIQALEKQIAKKRLIKQGVMQKLLTPKEGWVKKRLGDVCSIYGRIGFRGYTINDIVKKHEGAISLSPSNIIDNKLDFSKCTYISWDKYNESPEIKVYEGDIVFVKTASIGKTALVKKLPQETTLNPQLIVFKDIKINNALLSYFLSFKDFQNHIKAILVGGVVPTLSQTQIANFLISYPNSKLEQDEVAGFLMDIDSEIENLEQKLAKVTFLKQGLMQQLLTGKIRLNQL